MAFVKDLTDLLVCLLAKYSEPELSPWHGGIELDWEAKKGDNFHHASITYTTSNGHMWFYAESWKNGEVTVVNILDLEQGKVPPPAWLEFMDAHFRQEEE